MKPHRLLAALLAWAALASCAQTAPAPAPTSEPEAQRLGREIQALIGNAACTSDSQCHTIAVGYKACGGPGSYLAWSSAVTDGKRLAELATRQTQAQRAEVEASGMRSDCRLVTDSGAMCSAGRCQLRQHPTAPLAK